jgi:hypothetical protein
MTWILLEKVQMDLQRTGKREFFNYMKRLPAHALLAAGLMLHSVASYGQTSISSVPYTITAPGSYILANNLLYSSGSGAAIKINSANVTLDFDGHFVASTAASPQNYGVAVIQVRNVHHREGEGCRILLWNLFLQRLGRPH